ncbi:MAG: glycosyltransferase family 2 protein [Chthoniobacter sp.]|uniref:glycosyltransferase family 2 protein n=1 Tax=Chthoniobacter sp. TaxID=2510640 RepID=UPI0032A8D2C4
MNKVPVSFLVPVKNEAANLPRCLESIAWADEIWVVDSQSTDGTPAIAEAAGARVVQFQYNGSWPKKRNWALENLAFKHEWIFLIDADETLPPEAADELRAIATGAGECAAYQVDRRFWFLGQWLNHAYRPNWIVRFFQHRKARFAQLTDADIHHADHEIHEPMIVDGKIGRLRSEMAHYAFPTIESFVEKHNVYSGWEAHVTLSEEHRPPTHNFGWRQRLKRWSRHLPCRPLLRFLFVYVWQRGFLDGRAGYYFARLHAMYEFLSVAKTHELRLRQNEDSRLGH